MAPRRAIAIAALVAYGWWATSLRPFSTAATVAVVGAGVVATVWGIAHSRVRTRPVSSVGSGGWVALAAILAAWQLAAYVQTPRSEHPTLSSIANAALEPHAVRAVACAGWLLVAVRLAAR
jgi:hypothetical protein